ncbi:MAG: primosomal protein N', partial [Bacteroidia bacterium]|nr:primosomal protein N' [Bacteroidia bacterium]
MSERVTLFVDVVLPLSLPNIYTYRIPFELNDSVKIGQRVVVQFGKSKLYTVLVKNIHKNAPIQYEAKYIHYILDDAPVVNEYQFRLWEWIASYYMCYPGEVMNAALPAGLKLSSETKIIFNRDLKCNEEGKAEVNYNNLSDKEFLIVEALELRSILTMDEASEILEQKTAYSIIKSLLEKQIVQVQEDLKERYKPRLQLFVKLSDEWADEARLKLILDKLEKKSGKQLSVLMAYIKLTGIVESKIRVEWIKKAELLKLVAGADAAVKSLVKKNIFVQQEFETSRIIHENIKEQSAKVLDTQQQQAYENINKQFAEKDVVLLHGVTSSGKTEVYIKLIEQVLQQGRQVLYLLPEIALTTQIIYRLRNVFGDKVGIYHSRFSENERVEIWNNVLNSNMPNSIAEIQHTNTPSKIILGARSALFLPFSNLGLVIVDEEHDFSYKQIDPAPRYNARDSALFLAQLHRAKVVLGSATPSIESYFNAKAGKYGLVELMNRHGGVQLPEIILADIKDATKRKLMKSHFSPLLLDSIEQTLKNKEQVILFQNRRGFSPIIECDPCAWTPQCKSCDVSLTYH